MNMESLMALHDPNFRKAFGIRLKDLRKQKRWSQKELAAKVEIRFQQLNKYESGLNLPPAEMLVKLADALTTTVDYLLTGDLMEDTPLTSNRLFKRFRAVEHFNESDQEAVITLIDAMIAKQQMQSALQPLDDASNV